MIVPAGPGRDGHGERGRAPTARHLAREAGGAPLAHRPRRARSRPGTPRASPTAAPRSSSSPGPTPRPTRWSRWRPCGRGTRAASSPPAPGWPRPCASPARLNRAGLSESDVDLVEINEAFATMSVACARKLGFPHDIVNVNGGARRHRPPRRGVGRPDPGHADPRAAPPRRRHRGRDAVRRGRHGVGHRARGAPAGLGSVGPGPAAARCRGSTDCPSPTPCRHRPRPCGP